MLRLLLKLPAYRKRFSRPTDDPALRVFKRQFLLAGALCHELTGILGDERARAATFSMLEQIATTVQRFWYIPPPGAERGWAEFHRRHHHQMEHGIIRFNEHDEIHTTPAREVLFITRCRFFETFRDMGLPGLTEAFCRSDETVFNEHSPDLRFHRGPDPVNTIARGADRCAFIFEKV